MPKRIFPFVKYLFTKETDLKKIRFSWKNLCFFAMIIFVTAVILRNVLFIQISFGFLALTYLLKEWFGGKWRDVENKEIEKILKRVE